MKKRIVNMGHLANLCDQYVSVAPDDWLAIDIPALTKKEVLDAGLIPILDAEGEFVCLVKRAVADIMVEILNRFEPDIEEAE